MNTKQLVLNQYLSYIKHRLKLNSNNNYGCSKVNPIMNTVDTDCTNNTNTV